MLTFDHFPIAQGLLIEEFVNGPISLDFRF